MKRIMIYILCSVLVLSGMTGCDRKQEVSGSGVETTSELNIETTEEPEKGVTGNQQEPTEAPAVITIADITSEELVADMKIGWNLGNTLDSVGGIALESERAWGNPVTTQEMIDEVLAQGFNVIRIPVTWEGHFGDGPDYLIHDIWMNRVQEVVDYAYDKGAYVILNLHHEDWHFPSEENKEEASVMITALWTQIAERFKDYDEHLIFEGLNEPRKKGTAYEWNGGDKEGRDVVNHFMQVFVDAVRATGGNNTYRHLMVCGYAASSSTDALKSIKLPEDDKLIVSVHAYVPYNFALNTTGTSVFEATNEIDKLMSDIRQIFVEQGVPVIIGEFGAMNKENEEERVEWATYYVSKAREIGVPCIWWDNNAFAGSGENFGLFNRREMNWPYPDLLKALQDAAGVVPLSK